MTAAADGKAEAQQPESGGTPDTPIQRPTIVFAIEKGFNQNQVEKQFRDEGLNLVFAKTTEDVEKAIKEPSCYLIFVGIEFGKNGILLMRNYLKQTNAYWVVITNALSTQKRSALFQTGATDLLTHPVGAAQYKLRAKSMLGRYLKSFDMPAEVILPPGFNRKSEGQVQRGQAGEGQGGAREYHHRSGGGEGGAGDERGYNHVKGEGGAESEHSYSHMAGDNKEGHTHRFHDLSRDEQGREIRHRASGETENGPEWKHSSSEDPANPEWRHSKSSPEEKSESETKFFSKDPQAAWNNHHSQADASNPTHESKIQQDSAARDESSTKFFSKDPQAAWNNRGQGPVSPVEGKDDINFTRDPQLTKEQSEHLSATNPQFRSGDTTVNADPSAPGTSTSPNDASAPVGGNNGRANFLAEESGLPAPFIPLVPLETVRESLTLLDLIRRKVILLRNDVPWDPKLWSDHTHITSRDFQGLESALQQIRALFKETCMTLGCKRISLLSLRPQIPDETFPDQVFSIVSSDAAVSSNETFLSVTIPQLRIAFEDKKPFFLDEQIPPEIDGQVRANVLKLNGNIERMSAIIPLQVDRYAGVALFLQFDKPASDLTRQLLEQAVSYLSVPDKQYGIMDFLSRIYREMRVTI